MHIHRTTGTKICISRKNKMVVHPSKFDLHDRMASLPSNQIARTLPPWIVPIEADRNRPNPPQIQRIRTDESAKPNPTYLTHPSSRHSSPPTIQFQIHTPTAQPPSPPGFDAPAAGVAAR
jgi:hypothetical protein